jgi:hypothetical protein
LAADAAGKVTVVACHCAKLPSRKCESRGAITTTSTVQTAPAGMLASPATCRLSLALMWYSFLPARSQRMVPGASNPTRAPPTRPTTRTGCAGWLGHATRASAVRR